MIDRQSNATVNRKDSIETVLEDEVAIKESKTIDKYIIKRILFYAIAKRKNKTKTRKVLSYSFL